MAEHETIADIIAEKRRQADEIERDVAEKMKRNKMISDRYARELVADIRQEADRLEAALKRERGDAAKLREALSKFCAYSAVVLNTGMFNRVHLEALLNMAKAALARPPRNCDVGSAEEQAERYLSFTDRYNPCSYKGYARCAEDCPVHTKLAQVGYGDLLCQLEWAQMPYVEKEGGNDAD